MRKIDFRIFEAGTFRFLSIKFISKMVKERGDMSIYYQKLPTQSIQQQKHTSKLEEK